METKILLTLLVTLITFNFTEAQVKNLSLGFVGSYFDNVDNSNKFTDAKDPYAYGIVAGYQISKKFITALTLEYSKSDIEDNLGTQKDFRAHLSAYLLPFAIDRFHPYISAGVVFTNRKSDLTSSISKTKNFFNGRIGLGIDYSLISNLSFNVDLGFYNDGFNFVGVSSSAGLRYGLNLN